MKKSFEQLKNNTEMLMRKNGFTYKNYETYDIDDEYKDIRPNKP